MDSAHVANYVAYSFVSNVQCVYSDLMSCPHHDIDLAVKKTKIMVEKQDRIDFLSKGHHQ